MREQPRLEVLCRERECTLRDLQTLNPMLNLILFPTHPKLSLMNTACKDALSNSQVNTPTNTLNLATHQKFAHSFWKSSFRPKISWGSKYWMSDAVKVKLESTWEKTDSFTSPVWIAAKICCRWPNKRKLTKTSKRSTLGNKRPIPVIMKNMMLSSAPVWSTMMDGIRMLSKNWWVSLKWVDSLFSQPNWIWIKKINMQLISTHFLKNNIGSSWQSTPSTVTRNSVVVKANSQTNWSKFLPIKKPIIMNIWWERKIVWKWKLNWSKKENWRSQKESEGKKKSLTKIWMKEPKGKKLWKMKPMLEKKLN